MVMYHKTDYATEGIETTLTGKVREACTVFWQCRRSARNPQNIDFAVLVSRHMTEMADGMDILARNGTDGPMIPLLRSMLEALISLAYILLSAIGLMDRRLYRGSAVTFIRSWQLKSLLTLQRTWAKNFLRRVGSSWMST